MSNQLPDHLRHSGWLAPSVASSLTSAGVPLPTADYLTSAFDASAWEAAAAATQELTALFSDAHFADTATFGPLLVPNPQLFDVRPPLPRNIRRDQPEVTQPEFSDERIGITRNHCADGAPWSLFVTITSEAGLALGSYDAIVAASVERFTVRGYDTRKLMTLQLWKALTLQCGTTMPDCELRDSWTFTLFPGEELIDAAVISGTVLHGQVRQRLGKTTRGIKSARVRPAVFIAGAADVATTAAPHV